MSGTDMPHLDVAKLRAFLEARIPRTARGRVTSFIGAIVTEARKYDMRMATKHLWINYGQRRRKLKFLSNASVLLGAELSNLDPIAKEMLASRLPPETLEKVVGYLLAVRIEVDNLLRQTPQRGRPANIAEEFWVMAMADIFENLFERKPSASQARGAFFDLLQVAQPFRMAREGDLDARSLRRALKKREQYKRGAQSLTEAPASFKNLPPRL